MNYFKKDIRQLKTVIAVLGMCFCLLNAAVTFANSNEVKGGSGKPADSSPAKPAKDGEIR